jgi:hypothetical protein
VCIAVTNYPLGHTDQLSNNIALLAGICLGTVFRFWSYRTWVWRKQPAPADPAPAASTAPAAGTAPADAPDPDGQPQVRPAAVRLAHLADGRRAPVYVGTGRYAEEAGRQ